MYDVTGWSSPKSATRYVTNKNAYTHTPVQRANVTPTRNSLRSAFFVMQKNASGIIGLCCNQSVLYSIVERFIVIL